MKTALLAVCLFVLFGVLAGQSTTWLQLKVFDARLAALEPVAARTDRIATLSFDFRTDTVRLRVPYARESVRRAQAFDFAPAFGQRGWWRTRYLLRAVEIMATAVQSIPYGRVGAPLRTPLEVVASGSGVCTEKSVLLAALLTHEGYGAGVWSLTGTRTTANGSSSG